MNRAALKERILAVNIAEYVGQWKKETIKDIEFSMHLRIVACMEMLGITEEQLDDPAHVEAQRKVEVEEGVGEVLTRFAEAYFASLAEKCASSKVTELRQMMRELYERLQAGNEELGVEEMAHVPQMFMDSITPTLREVVLLAVQSKKDLRHTCEECFPNLDAERREEEVSSLIAELIPDAP